jgi:transcription elongation factor GreA
MSIRDHLPAILRGQEATTLDAAARDRLEALAADAGAEGSLAWARDECAGRLRQGSASLGVEYLLAAVCALNGEIERASQTLLALGEKLAAAKAWEPLAAVADRALGLEETGAAARLLVKAHEGLAREPDRIEALRRAWGVLPDDIDLGLLLAVRLGDIGELDERRALLAELTPRFAAEKRYSGLEEAALEFAEHEYLDGLVKLLETLPTLAGQGAFGEARQLADIAQPRLLAAGRFGEVLEPLRKAAVLAAAHGEKTAAPLRPALVEALRQGPGSALPDAAAVIAGSGLEDPERTLAEGLERFDVLSALPPGRTVFHNSFGAGRILSDDTVTVVIDFPKSRGHKMPYAAAKRTLTPVAEDDLRLLLLAQPGELLRLRSEQQAEVLVRALRAMGGRAEAQQLKVFLVGYGVVPANEWTGFLRRMKVAAEKDPRVDHSRAFQNEWALALEGAAAESAASDDVPLPPLEVRKPPRTILSTIRKFLAQHPQAEPRMPQRFGRFVERVMIDGDAERGDRARAGTFVARWYPDRAPAWREVLKQLWDQGLAVSDLSSEEEQLALLEASHAAGVEADAILSALDSRFASVRDRAREYEQHLDAAGRDALRLTLLEHATRYPAAALRLVESELTSRTPPTDGWRLLWAALSLVEDRPKPSTAEKVLGWFEPGGAFDRLLKGVPCPEERVLKTTVLLRQWRSSDRYLFPALEIADRLGLREAVETVRFSREQSAQRMFAQVGQQADVDLPIMTRATWSRLRKELVRMERELRTTIPETIRRARELGDLKENAEYHSAKLKQKTVSAQVASLQLRLARARFVDDATLQDGTVGLGTEVVLEGEHDLATYWVLGEDEQHHGANVISFQSAVGRVLMGHTIGDEVDLEVEVDAAPRRFRIVSVERKLPPHEAEATESAS